MVLEGIGVDSVEFPEFTVEMETGTGKTYCYFRTIYELNKEFGFTKFIIVVPSIAIYEAVESMDYRTAGILSLFFIPISYIFLLIVNRLNR